MCGTKMSRILYLNCIFILLFIIKSYVTANISQDLVVETPAGRIKGIRGEDGDYTMFLGIPFAKVNESNVFGSSIPQEPFEDVFEAYDDSAMCPQIEEFNSTVQGSLDCLHLHVYVPDSANSTNILPVMVYIHGGGFTEGFASRYLFGPKYLVRYDVILITLNYRLGAYGFMCLDTPEVPGNAGLKDQATALRWIQNNIVSFGGDPNQVTVFGNSAGGRSTGLHMMSEHEPLFQNAILQSGTPWRSNHVGNANTNAVLALAAALNFVTYDINAALKFLNNADVGEVVLATQKFGQGFGACVEKEFPGVERLLAEHPLNSKQPKAAGMAVMLGFNSDELLDRFASPETEGIIDYIWWASSFRSNLQSHFDFDETQLNELSALVRRFYVGDKDINSEVRREIMDYMNDNSFVYSTIRAIAPYLEAGVVKVYQYLFSYDGNRNFVKVKDNINVPGAAHADEIGYLFSMGYFDSIGIENTEDDQLIVDRMTTMWTNFAKYRDPTPETNAIIPAKWEAITQGSPYHYIDITTNMTASTRYEHGRMTFWDLFYKTYAKYERGYVDTTEVDEENYGEIEIEGEGGDPEGTEDGVEDNVPNSSTSMYFHSILQLIVVLVNLFAKISYSAV